MSGDPVSDVLLRTADRLEQPRVWAQASWTSPRQTCALFAIIECDADDRVETEACERLRRVIRGQSILDWNDAPDRTVAEVVTALRQAAQLKGSE